MIKINLLLAAACLAIGCPYAAGSVSYSQRPELRSVRLYSGSIDRQGENLGVVELSRDGKGDCTELAAQAMLDLLREAQALGGTGLKDVKFRGRFNWMGRVVCRRSISGMSVQVQGMATR